jgi:GT2 family glycosyltransferase
MALYTVDIIILSYAKNDNLKQITSQAINSLLNSENPDLIHFNVLVIESNKELYPYQFDCSKTIYPEEKFGFHRYLNIGIEMTNASFVCLCNNDLIFEKNWATEILKEMEKDSLLLSASPYCSDFHAKRNFIRCGAPIAGYENGIVAGWCIFVRRSIFNIIGQLDEQLEFWYCDNDYGKTLEFYQIKHCLILSSFVTHLTSQSISNVDKKISNNLTRSQYLYYDYKWNHNSRLLLFLKSMKLKLTFWMESNQIKLP